MAHSSVPKLHWHLLLICLLFSASARTRAEDVTAAWVQRYYSYLTNGMEIGYQVVTDPGGNFIVVGTADNKTTSGDMLILKYSPAGGLLWSTLFNGPANSSDSPEAVAVDSGGNIFVTGYSRNITNNSRVFATVAYSSAGVPLWTNYHGAGLSGTSEDGANSVALDDNGHVFVTGTAGAACTTIAYSTAGAALWTNRLAGSGMAVAADHAGNVFVAGSTAGDYATIKYSNAGLPLWTNRYNGPGNDSDSAQALAISASGDVIVTGISLGAGSGMDFATIKYSNAGVPLWTNRYSRSATGYYDQGQAVTVDHEGNVLVTGSSLDGSSSSAFTTIKYSSAGAPLWTKTYSQFAAFLRDARTVAVDTANNVIISGNYGALKYSSAGELLWVNAFTAYGARGMTVDAKDNVVVTGFFWNGPSQDCLTIKYSPDGATLWEQAYNGPSNSEDVARASVLDDNGDIIVTGYSKGQHSGDDFVTVKYTSAGLPLWTNAYNGPGNTNDQPVAVAVNPLGQVFVTGVSAWSGDDLDFATVAYSSSGLPLWTNRFSGSRATPGLSTDTPQAVATDEAGNVFVLGTSFQNYANAYVTIAYSTGGAALWTNYYKSSANSDDYARAMAVDRNGHVFVTGFSYGNVPGFADYETIAYSSTGALLWTARFKGSPSTYDYARAVTADASGNVIVTGDSSADFATVKYTGAGTPLWTNFFSASGGSYEFAQAVTTDANGDVFVTGYSASDSRGRYADYVTIKYSSAGLPLWTNIYSETATSHDRAKSVAVDGHGDVFVTGTSTNGSVVTATTIGYSTAGAPLWTNRYYKASAQALVVGAPGKFFVTGTAFDFGSSDFLTIKYLYHSSPEITTQPASHTNNVGTTAVFNVTAEGDEPLSYQWRKNGLDLSDGNKISGATTASLALSQITTNDVGSYSVLITNAYGQALSSNAVLYVNRFPQADASATVRVVISANSSNAPVTLDGSRSSDPDGDPLRFSWYRAGEANPFATGVVAVVTLPVGTNALLLVVDDGLATNHQAFTVEVITSAEAVERLVALVRSGAANPQPLIAKLLAALAAIDRTNPTAAINQLIAFQNQVRARWLPLDPALAEAFLQAAQQIIDSLIEGSKAHGKLTVFPHQADGKTRLRFEAEPGALYLIEASTNLLDWEKIGTAVEYAPGEFELEDPNAAPVPMRFYRLFIP